MKKIVIILAFLAALKIGTFQEPTTAEEMKDIRKNEIEYLYKVWEEMPDNIFESIALKLGDGCTEIEIAREYLNNREKYDSLGEDTVINY